MRTATATLAALAAFVGVVAGLPVIALLIAVAAGRRAYRLGFLAGFWNATLDDVMSEQL